MIYAMPHNTAIATVLRIDPTTDTAVTFGALGSGVNKWAGCVLAPNGVIYGIPFTATTVVKVGYALDDVPLDFCLSRHFNKF
jgi:hypothetical protein